MTYYFRTLAVACLAAGWIFATSLIGTTQPTRVYEWTQALEFVATLASLMWLGWQARKEQETKP